MLKRSVELAIISFLPISTSAFAEISLMFKKRFAGKHKNKDDFG